MTKSIVVATAALFVHVFGLFALNRRIEPFMYNFYVISWWSYIFFLDALLSLKLRRFLIINRRLPHLALISCAFWCAFELINLRLKNWFYINIPDWGYMRYFGYAVAFGTVIPGIYLAKEVIHRAIGDLPVRPVSFKPRMSTLVTLGFLILLLVLLFPRFLFALTWVFLIPIMDVVNYRLGHTSFIREMAEGRAGAIVSTLLAGMACGFLWEVWNYWAISKWVYSVPLFEDVKLFEMPILGYLGFAFFAIETIAFLNFFNEVNFVRTHAWTATLVAIIFSLGTFGLIERHTVFSNLTRIQRLQFISKAKREQLEKQGARYSYAIDRSILNLEESEFLDLVELKGLGLNHALQLKEKGIHNKTNLSRLSPGDLCAMIHEREERRCRVYVKAAGGHR